MVSVCGRGGAGKTALVSRLIEHLSLSAGARAADSVVYVEMGSEVNRSAGRIVECIADTLNARARDELLAAWRQSRSPAEGLKSLFGGALTAGRCLIVLDNFESVLDEHSGVREDYRDLGDFLEESLSYAHTALVLVVTRFRPVFPPEVEGRTLRRRRELSLDAGLPPHAAKSLLQSLDSEDRYGFLAASGELLDVVVSACGCIPRTLEAIYGYLCLHPRQTIQSLLADARRFHSLVEAPFRELYRSLPQDSLRRIVQALSVYRQQVPAGALRTVLPDLAEEELNDGLDMLVLNHVVGAEQNSYSLHPLDREYAYAQISGNGTAQSRAALEERAAEWYLSSARPPSECYATGDVEPQLNAFHHLVRAGKADRACEVLNSIDREHLAQWGYQQGLIELRSQLLDNILDPYLRGLNLGNLGAAYFETGNLEQATQLYERALASARQAGQRQDEGRWIGNLGLAHSHRGDMVKAREYVQRALEIAREIGDVRHQGRWLGNIGLLCQQAGNEDEALRYYAEAVPFTQQAGDHRFEKLWLSSIAQCHVQLKQLDTAAEYFELAASVARRLHLTIQAVQFLARMAAVYLESGDTEKAAGCYQRALEVAREGSDDRSAAAQAELLAAVAQVTGATPRKRRQVTEYLEQAAEIVHRLGNFAAQAALLQNQAETFNAMGEADRAAASYEKALAVVREYVKDRDNERNLLINLGATHYFRNDVPAAVECYQQALAIARERDDRESQSVALFNIGDAYDLAGDAEAAIPYYMESLALESSVTDYKAACNLGVGYLKLGKPEAARPHLARCVELCGQRIGPATNLHPLMSAQAVALMAIGKTQEGLKILEAGLSRCDNAAHRYYTLQDLLLLQRAAPDTPGLEQALQLARQEQVG